MKHHPIQRKEYLMATVQTLSVDPSRSKTTVADTCQRFFYSGSAILMFLFMFWGFYLFYLHGKAYPGRPLTPPIRSLLIAHGIAMTGWMILFIIQPLLVATRNVRLHMKLGLFGAGLSVAATILGLGIAIGAARVNPPELKLWGLDPRQFLLVSSSAIVLFAIFATLGILNRRKPDVHKPMMLLAALSILPPSLDRITVIHRLFEGTVMGTLFGAYSSSLVVGLALVCLHWAFNRKPNRWLMTGYAGIVVVAFATMQIAPTTAWAGIAHLLAP